MHNTCIRRPRPHDGTVFVFIVEENNKSGRQEYRKIEEGSLSKSVWKRNGYFCFWKCKTRVIESRY